MPLAPHSAPPPADPNSTQSSGSSSFGMMPTAHMGGPPMMLVIDSSGMMCMGPVLGMRPLTHGRPHAHDT